MEQNYKSIKATKEFCFSQIKVAETTLRELREQCDHPETELCTYSTRPGQNWEGTEICSICGEVVKWPYEGMDIKIETDGNVGITPPSYEPSETLEVKGEDPWTCDDCGNSVYNCKCDPC